MVVRKLPNGEDRLHSKIPKYFHLILHFVEEWKKIVTLSHTSRDPHLGIIATKYHITSQGWLVDARNHGIPQDYIREFINGRS